MTRVNLPKSGKENGKNTGCYGLDFPDGSKVNARPGGSVDLDDNQAAMLRNSPAARSGLLNANLAMSIGTKAGRYCPQCGRTWQAWTHRCHKCHQPTVPC